MAGLLVGIGVITSTDIAMGTVIKAVPFNFYCIIMVFFCCFNAFGILPDYGPDEKGGEKSAERRKGSGRRFHPAAEQGADQHSAERRHQAEPCFLTS